MQHRFLTTILLLAVLATGSAAAPKKRAAAPPVPSLLTEHELDCQAYGIVAELIGTFRDQEVPMTTAIAGVRKYAAWWTAKVPAQTPAVTETMVGWVPLIYTHPEISPARHRYLMELACLQPAEAALPAATGPQY